MSIAVVVGNPKAGSRTLRVALGVADALAESNSSDHHIVDLAEFAPELFDYESTTVKTHLEAVAGSDLVVVASPTYKATYTGLLKVFLDRYGNNGLAGTVCVPVMTGAAPIHALAPEVHLRPLLVELGASTPSRGLYVTEPEFDTLDQVVNSWAVAARPRILQAINSGASTRA